jgi:tight adherence protein B
MMLYDPTGQKMVIAAFVLMIAGIFWMQRIVRIDV